jgi:predicted enzyme related to lactoylglutathione lyase
MERLDMKRIQGIGGIFFKAQNPEQLQDWYDKHLGISPLPHSPWGADDPASLFEWRDKDDESRKCYTVFAPFPNDTDYFEPGKSSFMFNFRVDDLDALLETLGEEGIQLHGEIKQYSYGRFARIIDPEGNPVELWEPAEGF